MQKQLEKKQDLLEIKKQTLINILSSKGIIYTHYKNKQKGKNETKNKQHTISQKWNMW